MLSTHHLSSTNGIHFQDNVHLPDEYIIPGLIDIAQSDNAYCCLLLSSYLVVVELAVGAGRQPGHS